MNSSGFPPKKTRLLIDWPILSTNLRPVSFVGNHLNSCPDWSQNKLNLIRKLCFILLIDYYQFVLHITPSLKPTWFKFKFVLCNWNVFFVIEKFNSITIIVIILWNPFVYIFMQWIQSFMCQMGMQK